jgi:hypothetical protein
MIIWNKSHLHYKVFGIYFFKNNFFGFMIKDKTHINNYWDCKGIVGNCGMCDNSCKNLGV